jgi:hypothetical protein
MVPARMSSPGIALPMVYTRASAGGKKIPSYALTAPARPTRTEVPSQAVRNGMG